MRVLIAGGTGFLGTELSRSLIGDGHQVWVLSRNPKKTNLPTGVQVVEWDGRTAAGWVDVLDEIDVVVNLCGLSLASGYWTESRKRRFISSRAEPGEALVAALRDSKQRPGVFLQISGVGYYGLRRDPVQEGDPAGDDFPAQICVHWEKPSNKLPELGIRRVIMRTAPVLARGKGLLPLIALPISLMVGGPLGGGQQGFPWIHVEDQIRAMRFLMENDGAEGIYNLSAPELLSSNQFMRALAKAMQRPYWFPVPAFLLRILLGELSVMLLEGQYPIPKRLLEMGYQFKYPEIQAALDDLYR